MGGMMNGYGMGNGFFGNFLVFGLIFLLLIIAIVAIVVWMVKPGSGSRDTQPTGDERGNESADDILRKRLARGEISEEEYDRLSRKMKE
ncbi:SHOCT domain-containing protein [Salimicrobium flavidum]|uniref:Putative membrane protein n=1 Tax=Salimicrobium flavidum TaxID=570947 RepID=A0A1N7JFC3_9BACI|nr:SHOCT domain-containing protein [Salimicrobium flavidum]SIS48053.1 putative membrane protein [Salimicrobium flavidum]